MPEVDPDKENAFINLNKILIGNVVLEALIDITP